MSSASFGLLPEDISIVTDVYNYESTVSKKIESVLIQKTKYGFHLYCINDSSTDESGSILQAYQARYPELIAVLTGQGNKALGKSIPL